MNNKISVFIGYDQKEVVAYHVLAHSLITGTRSPISISPIKLDQLGSVFNRPRDPKQSTDFSFSRFMVPWLCNYQGWALFMDCDMLSRSDLTTLWSLRDDAYAVMVVKHDYVPRDTTKFLGNVQTSYAKKNWSSLMLLNCARCTALTPDYVNRASGLELHQFRWLASDDQIGSLPCKWNHLVGEYEMDSDAKVVHFTLGGPWWPDFTDCQYADEWRACHRDMLASS